MTVDIRMDERAAFVGATGSGKTVLADYVLNFAGDRVLVIDPKHTYHKEGFKHARSLPFFDKKFKIIYRPQVGDDAHMLKLLQEVYKRGNIRIYVDEVATMASFFPKSTALLEDIARTGRERHISLWMATQRPRRIPLSFFTETEVWFVFLLRNPLDRKLLRDMVGEKVENKVSMYHFNYVRPGMEEPILLMLSLEDNKLMEIRRDEKVKEVA